MDACRTWLLLGGRMLRKGSRKVGIEDVIGTGGGARARKESRGGIGDRV